jgi:hypothetical protein
MAVRQPSRRAAGNFGGCDAHDELEYVFSIDEASGELDLVDVALLLDELEPQAAALVPRELLECRFFGACGW